MPMSFGTSSRTGRPVAELRLVDGIHYRRESFIEGFSRLGYEPRIYDHHQPQKDDVLVLWNRYRRDELRAKQYEDVGARIMIVENAWLGPEDKDQHWFALSMHHHNLAWRVGNGQRWDAMNIPIKPWREAGEVLLLLPQRGMGEEGIAQPKDWYPRTVGKLHMVTKRPIRVRTHPGLRPHPDIDFTNIWACITWASGAALKAIVAGIPVFYELENWIGGEAAVRGFDDLEKPFLGDRLPMLRQLAWRMWTAEEIATGYPLECLLSQSTSTKSFEHERKSVPQWLRESGGSEIELT